MPRPSFRAALLLTLLFMPSEALLSRELQYSRFQLENGLTVILHEDRRLPLVAVNLWYHVGSKDEPPGRSGFAHLFEHLMFMGTEAVPDRDFDTIMESAGGSNNATHLADRTNYFESGPAISSRRSSGSRPTAWRHWGSHGPGEARHPARRRPERAAPELREPPYGKGELEIPRLLYPKGHPYHHPVIGSHEDLDRGERRGREGLLPGLLRPRKRDTRHRWRHRSRAREEPRREALRPDTARPGSSQEAAATSSAPPGNRALPGGGRRGAAPERLRLAFAPIYAEGDADLDVLATLIAGGKSSRLYETLVYEKKTAQEVAAYQSSRLLGSELRILVHARPGCSQDEIEADVDREIERLRADGPTQREVDRARNRIETTFWQGLQSVSERADLLNTYQFHFGDPGSHRPRPRPLRCRHSGDGPPLGPRCPRPGLAPDPEGDSEEGVSSRTRLVLLMAATIPSQLLLPAHAPGR